MFQPPSAALWGVLSDKTLSIFRLVLSPIRTD